MVAIISDFYYGKEGVPWLRYLITVLSLWRPKFVLKSVHVGFLVDKVALGQFFL
jgi:hypothetical protein